MSKIVTTLYEANLSAIVRNIENFNFLDGDCETVLRQSSIDHHIDLMIGFDRFTENEDGTICNSENDTNHYYIELWDSEDEEEPLEICWLSEDPDEREQEFFELLTIATTTLNHNNN